MLMDIYKIIEEEYSHKINNKCIEAKSEKYLIIYFNININKSIHNVFNKNINKSIFKKNVVFKI